MRNVRFGIGIFTAEPLPKVVDEVKLAERLGYDSVWLLDSQLVGREVYATMAACAQATSRINIASGVTNPSTRHLTVTACGHVTLNELAPGRIILGLGRGDSSVKSLGLEATPLKKFPEDVAALRSMLAGKRVQLDGREVRLTFVNPDRPPEIPIFIASGGAKSLHVAAQVGDGVLIHNGPNEELIAKSLEIVRAGAAEAGKKLEDMRVVWWVHTSIGRDWAAVKEHARAKIATKFRQRKAIDISSFFEFDEETRRKAVEAYNFLDHASPNASHGWVADLVPEPIWREFSLLGTGEEARERVERVVSRFPEITDVVINPPVPGHGITYESILHEFAEAVLPRAIS